MAGMDDPTGTTTEIRHYWTKDKKTGKQVLARVSIVDWEETVLLDTFVHVPPASVD